MAVSIAVNWTPSASSPLFDDDTTASVNSAGNSSQAEPQLTSSPSAPVNTNNGFTATSDSAGTAVDPQSSSPSKDTMVQSSSLSHPNSSSLSPDSTQASATVSRSVSPQPRSYAAAAASAFSNSSNSSTSPPHSLHRPPSANSRQAGRTSQQQQQAPLPAGSGVPQLPQPVALGAIGSAAHHQQQRNLQANGTYGPQQPQEHRQSQHNQQQFFPQQPQHGHFHHQQGFGTAYNAAYLPPMPNQYAAWAQYQQMMASQPHMQQQRPFGITHGGDVHANDTSRGVSTGNALPSLQRPTPLTYNDSFQHQPYPGVTYASASRGALAPAASGTNSFHPYRRQGARPSDAVAGVAGLVSSSSSLSLVPSSQRSRASSTESRNDATATAGPHASATTNSGVARHAAPPAGEHRSQSIRHSSSDSSNPAGAPRHPTPVRRPETRSRTESQRSASSGMATPPSLTSAQTSTDLSSMLHSRSGSVSSQSSAFSSALSDKTSTIGRSTPVAASVATSKKSSPLSRTPAARTEDDEEDDDDDDTHAEYGGSDREDGPLTKNGDPEQAMSERKKKGLGGKLRKALSLSTVGDMQQADAKSNRPSAAPSGRALPASLASDSIGSSRSVSERPVPSNGNAIGGGDYFGPEGAASSAASVTSRRSTRPPISGSADGSGKRSLFNRKFNNSTDNISISSTVSSASVMLRKVGNLGKIARRHSLMGLTNMFNKDKGVGREGLHGDDFGELPVPADETALANAGAKGKKSGKKGKGDLAMASISRATVELDPNGDGGMTPAAHYVRQHQIQMQQQAEAETRAARQHQEAADTAAAAASKKGKTTDDVVESRQKMIEKEKERLKSKRGWKNRLRVGGGGGSVLSIDQPSVPSGLETMPYDEHAEHSTNYSMDAPRGVYPGGYNSIGSMPLQLSEQQLGEVVGGLDAEDLEPPRMPAAGACGSEESGDEGETDSLRHWSEGIERSRASAARVTNPKGILKKGASYSQLDQELGQGFSRPFAGRMRANSYDAPPTSAPGAPMLSSMSTTTDGVDRMDGVVRASCDEPRNAGSQATGHLSAQQSQAGGTSVSLPMYGHHSNSSMPTLSLMTKPTSGSITGRSTQKRRICFTEVPIYHSTWPAHVYDRHGELATCNRLTQELAAQIKEELNSYKMEEMEVAPSSRIFTHFFV